MRERHNDAVQPADGVGHRAEEHRAGEAAEDERVDPEHGEADGAHLGRGGGGQRQEDADGQRRHGGAGQELQGHAQPELGHVERQHEEPAVGRDADAGDDQRPLGGAAEVAVAEDVGQREPEEGGQADDGVHLAARGRVEVELVDEEQVAEQRRAGPGEAEDGHRHQLVVERADPQQPGHGGAEEDPGRLLLLGVQVHARRLEDVAALVGALLRLAQGEEGEAERNAGQRHQQAVAPIVRRPSRRSRRSGSRSSATAGPTGCAS